MSKREENILLILGEKYKFTDLEIQRLAKKFPKINQIAYKDQKSELIIKEIKDCIDNDIFKIVVLNTRATVDNSIIKYLTNLKFNITNKNFKIISIEHFLEEYLHKCYIPEDNTDLHYLDDIKRFSLTQRFQKKIIDLIAIVFLLPLVLLLKFKVKSKLAKESPGSIYYKQFRVGLNNKKFKCIKFRSMHEHDSAKDVRTATKGDSRIFPFGERMRKTRIDEIPQVFNIIKGELSLIGPRAEWDQLTKEYEMKIPYYNQRHVVKPGITGWAQVMFVEGRSKDDTRQKLMYDLYYIKYWSLLLELKVIWKTIIVVLGKKGI